MAKRKFSRRVYVKNAFLERLLFIFKLLSSFFALGLVVFLFLVFYYSRDLPQPEKFSERRSSQPTKIYDRTGENLLYTIFGEEKREIISLDKMSPYLKNAVVAVEDKNFYSRHFGIDFRGIARAILADLKVGASAQGASTIPQQLIRSTFLTPEKTIERKAREIILSIELDFRYSKDDILGWYLNQVPFGSNAYGAEAASETFFSKKASDLTLAEAATLASLIQRPTTLSPYGKNLNLLLERKDYALDRMVKEGYISPVMAQEAKKEKLNFAKPSAPIVAPHFVIYVKKYLEEKYGEEYLQTNGLKVYTTLDINLQKSAEEFLKNGVTRNENFRAFNAALVAIDPHSGDILAMIGSKDYFAESYPKGCTPAKDCLFEPEFDVATMGLRQPGSAFKPFVYVTAFEKGYSDQAIVIDEQTDFGIWGGKHYVPQNYDGLFRGPVTLRQGLAQSLNVPSIKVLMNLSTIKDSIETAKKMGITSLREYTYYGPALVLGGGEVTLLDMVSSYSVLASGGLKMKPSAILKIEDGEGQIIEQREINPKRVLSSKSAQLITSILSDNEARAPIFGLHSSLYVSDSVAVKTGTTQNYKDAWSIGYDKDIVVGVWAGNNDNSPTNDKPGVALAAPIWKNFIKATIEGRKQ